jgi:hypothetical protein
MFGIDKLYLIGGAIAFVLITGVLLYRSGVHDGSSGAAAAASTVAAQSAVERKRTDEKLDRTPDDALRNSLRNDRDGR